MDPYLFQNFLTEDGDQLEATFKAFKFPESNFVLFKGTVNVCLDRCTGVSADQGNIPATTNLALQPVELVVLASKMCKSMTPAVIIGEVDMSIF